MKRPVPYPALFRFALLAAVTVGALTSFSAAQGVGMVAMASSASPEPASMPGWFSKLMPYAQEQEAAMQAGQRAAINALESMGGSRVVILLALSAAASMVFLGALFIRWSLNAPRTAIARMLGAAAFGAAVLRTLDGAQKLVIDRRIAEANVKALLAANVPPDVSGTDFLVGLSSAISVGWTVFVVTLFVLLGTYFRSDGVRSLLEAIPEQDEE